MTSAATAPKVAPPALPRSPIPGGNGLTPTSTPLLDAVGHGAALLDKRKEAGERCILAVMTDRA